MDCYVLQCDFIPYSFAQPREIGAIVAETPQGEASSSQTKAAWFPIPPSGTRRVSRLPLSQSRYPFLAAHEFAATLSVPKRVVDISHVVTAVHPRP